MLHIPISRWGEPYKSMEADKVVHFITGEELAEVSRSNGALVERDMRQAHRARARAMRPGYARLSRRGRPD